MSASNTPKASSKGGSGRHGRTKSGLPDDPPLLAGWLARESGVVDKLLNKRYGALYSTVFVTYRKREDETPSKVWPLSREMLIGDIKCSEYHLRHPKTSTLWAVASGAYEALNMWAFSLTWPNTSGILGGSDTLTLAYDSKEEAEEWRVAFQQASEKVEPSGSLVRLGSAASNYSAAASFAEGATPRAVPGEQPDGKDATQGGEQQKTLAVDPARKGRTWASFLHINGIAVYIEELDEDGEGGAVMVSAVVRAPPEDVFRQLVQLRKKEAIGIFSGARTLEVIDANTQVVTQQWRASGAAGSLCAAREVVLLRTWRKDTDGTYIVLFQSTKHRSVPLKSGWGKPVRVQVQAAGFTIAPLLPRFTDGGESREALVTMVLKADLGGFLSDSSLLGRALSPLKVAAQRSMLEPLVTSIIVLRDRVEQDRFVVRPLSMAHDEPEPAAAEGGAGTVLDAAPARRFQRSATMLAYNKEPLLLAQKRAAKEAGIDGRAAAAVKPLPDGVMPERDTAAEQASLAWAIGGTCPPQFWTSPGDGGFKVRGATYLTDRKKVPAAPPVFELVAVDLLEVEENVYDVCRFLPSVRYSPAPFLFSVQLMVPAVPPISLVATWAASLNIIGMSANDLISQYEAAQGPCPDNITACIRAITEFVNAEGPDGDKLRNQKFKLIPNIPKGSWLIRQSVGTTPVILGQKLTTKYYRGPNYFEVDVDISSSSVAASITNMVAGATKSLTVDLGVLIEGQVPEQLPEQLLGTVRLDRLDLGTAAYLDDATGTVIKSGSEVE